MDNLPTSDRIWANLLEVLSRVALAENSSETSVMRSAVQWEKYWMLSRHRLEAGGLAHQALIGVLHLALHNQRN